TEGLTDGPRGDLVAQLFERRIGGPDRLDTESVLDTVRDRVDPGLMIAVGVVRDLETPAPRRDLVRPRPETACLAGSEFENLRPRQVSVETGQHAGGVIPGRHAGTAENLVADGAAVDRPRYRMPAQPPLFTAEMWKTRLGADPQVLRGRRGDGAVPQVGVDNGQRAGGNRIEHIQVAGQQIGVG